MKNPNWYKFYMKMIDPHSKKFEQLKQEAIERSEQRITDLSEEAIADYERLCTRYQFEEECG